jgi:exostosin family protein
MAAVRLPGMSQNVYLANSYPWLSRQLRAGEPPDSAIAVMVDSPREADVIIYPKTDLNEEGASDRLLDFSPSELQRTCVFSQLDEPFPWAPGMYASLSARYAKRGFTGGFYVAQHHNDAGGITKELEAARELEPDLLWSFVGTISNHPVRAGLLNISDERCVVRDSQRWSDSIRWGWKTDYREEAIKAFSGFAGLLGRSKFAVCPRGRGAASIRLFEALRVGRTPVIVSDEWLPPPFVDWGSCSIRVAEQDVGLLPEILREREGEAEEMGERARAVWERRFSPQRQLGTLVEGCLLAADSAPARATILVRACFRRQSIRRGLRRAKEKIDLPSRSSKMRTTDP